MKIETVLFDLGNVLIYIDFDAFWRCLGISAQEKEIYKLGYTNLTRRYETGLTSTDEYLSGLHELFEHRFSKDQLRFAFENIMRNPVEGMEEIVIRISEKYKTGMVSNTNDIHYTQIIKKYDNILKNLHKHYLSYKLQVMKPCKKFYELIIKDQNINPSKIFFIDDLETNVEGAKLAGIEAVKFEGVAHLEKVIRTF